MKTETVAIESVSPDPANARKHGEKNLASIRDSLRAFGQQKPIVVDSRGIVIAGNGTLECAKSLGWKEISIVRTDLDPSQATAFGIADNRTSELAEWDDEVLRSLLDTMDDQMLDVLAFDQKEIDALLPPVTVEIEEDEISETVEARTKPGDLWTLGGHRVFCGDSTNESEVLHLFDGSKADFGFTSPPYNAGDTATGAYAGGSAKRYDRKKLYRHSLDDMDSESYVNFLLKILEVCSKVLDETAVMGWNTCYNAKSRREYGEVLFSKENPLPVQETIVWDKTAGMNIAANHIYSRSSEFVFLLARSENYKSNQCGGVYWNTWRHTTRDGDNMRNGHGASFPVALPSQAIVQHSNESDTVYDPFLGSGTTLIAAEQLDRRCFGMEIDPTYCDVIVDRWEKLTGETATK